MLLIARSMNEVNFLQLMHVYEESNRRNGRLFYPRNSEKEQVFLAERDFFSYLHDVFFADGTGYYALWAQDQVYTSALRLEPYRDGFLITSLETAPDMRGEGHATNLLRAVLSEQPFSEYPIYTHVEKRNSASLAVFHNCSFCDIEDRAVYIDGSVSAKAYTLRYQTQ